MRDMSVISTHLWMLILLTSVAGKQPQIIMAFKTSGVLSPQKNRLEIIFKLDVL